MPISNELTIGEIVAWLRTQRTSLSSRGLSLQAGLSPSYVGKVEAGHLDPSLRAFGLIAQTIGMNEGEVFVAVMCAAGPSRSAVSKSVDVTPEVQDGQPATTGAQP